MGNKGNSPVGLFRRPIRILVKQLLVKLSQATPRLRCTRQAHAGGGLVLASSKVVSGTKHAWLRRFAG